MHEHKQNLYQVLGVERDAKAGDIHRAYKKIRAEMGRENVPPDPRRAALVTEAFGILSDPGRRAQYDASLRQGFALDGVPAVQGRSRRVAAVAVLAILAGAAAYLAFGPEERKPAKSAREIGEMASLAVGRLHRIDLSGQTSRLGVAFAIEEGVLVTSCEGLAPGAQYFVSLPPRKVPASVATADEARGLCRLSASGMGSWPLLLSSVEPRAGDPVFGIDLNAAGQPVVKEGRVKRISTADEQTRVIETSLAPGADAGAPLIDGLGRVVAIAARAKDGGAVRHVGVPAAWLVEAAPAARTDVPPEPRPEPGDEASGSPLKREPVEIPARRREALEKAFRPPPAVPDDL